MSFQTKTVYSSLSPWEVFQNVYQVSRKCFFLDSAHYLPPNQTYSYIGMDPQIVVLLCEGQVRVLGRKNENHPQSRFFDVLRVLLKEMKEKRRRKAFFTGGLVGYFGYEVAPLCDAIRLRRKKGCVVPEACFGLFSDLIVYDHRTRNYQLVSRSGSFGKLESCFQKKRHCPGEFSLKRFNPGMSKTDFKKIVRSAKKYIGAGDIYQANLSQRFNFEFDGSALALYGKLREINPSPFSSFYKMDDLQIVSVSPERLVRKTGRVCETRPIAGTCKAYGPECKLREWKKVLAENPKERAEHLMLVDLERNDLGRVCDYRTVSVDEFMTLEKYSHVVHLVSKITGRLKRTKDILDLIRAMFPGGTITGCPKIRCMEVIDELEPVRRGIYTGSLGYMDFCGDGDLNIMIRTIVLKGRQGNLQVGAGIVWDSDPEKEYEETLHKGKALVKALTEAGIKNGDSHFLSKSDCPRLYHGI